MKTEDLMDNNIYINMINTNIVYIKNKMKENNISKIYDYAIVLGSGLKGVVEDIEIDFEINYKDMPFMPKSNVKGHDAKFIFGTLYNKNIVVMSGRFHYYEGHHMRSITMPIRIMKKIGVEKIIITTAAGAINEKYNVSDIMIFENHIGTFIPNPLIGENLDEFGIRFPIIEDVYNTNKIDYIYDKSSKMGINIHKGVYACLTGPGYETKAELNMLKILGVDSVSMSTIPDIMVARHCGMEVLAFSCITNICSNSINLGHDEVVENAKIGSKQMKEAIKISLEVI